MGHMKEKMTVGRFFVYLFAILFAFVCLYPFLMVIGGSLMTNSEVVNDGFKVFPKEVTFASYKLLLGNGNLIEGFSFDATDVKTEVAQRNQIFGDAQKLLEVGLAGDTDTALEKIKTDSEGAGFQSVLDEYQRQIDEFLAAKDK